MTSQIKIIVINHYLDNQSNATSLDNSCSDGDLNGTVIKLN
jgi:hypothetical protein